MILTFESFLQCQTILKISEQEEITPIPNTVNNNI